jgi:hypothetical protein
MDVVAGIKVAALSDIEYHLQMKWLQWNPDRTGSPAFAGNDVC